MFDGLGRFYKNSSTHILPLIKCVQATDGPVLELGSGIHSTPLLHWLCFEKKRFLLTYEDNEKFYHLARKFQSRNHRIRMTAWNLDLSGHWSVALVDQASRFRWRTAVYLSDKVDYVILHDSESPAHYKYEKVFPHYKFRFDYKEVGPYTTILSNFKDLSWLS
jgi:hypothetical protein